MDTWTFKAHFDNRRFPRDKFNRLVLPADEERALNIEMLRRFISRNTRHLPPCWSYTVAAEVISESCPNLEEK